MKLLDDYFKLQKEIYDYFGYVEDWEVIPIDDARNMYWKIYEDIVKYTESTEQVIDKEAIDAEAEDYYENRIYAIYLGKEYTMICVDTFADGNKFLQIFDNKKQVKD